MDGSFNYFENTRYINNREQKQSLIIKTDVDHTGKNFNLKLQESLIIDTLSDIYLDSFITFNIGPVNANNVRNKQYFILNIDQFELRGISNIDTMNRKIIIPNDDSSGNSTVKVHKGKKMNYICSINPTKINKITGTITDKEGGDIIGNTTIEIIKSVAGRNIIISGETLTSTSSNATPGSEFNVGASISDTANNLKDTINANTTLQSLNISASVNGSVVTIVGTQGHASSGNYIDNGDAVSSTSNFMAEFLIVSRKN